jgi:hypothetical protein
MLWYRLECNIKRLGSVRKEIDVPIPEIDREMEEIVVPPQTPKLRKMNVRLSKPSFDAAFWDRWSFSPHLTIEKTTSINLASIFGRDSLAQQLFRDCYHYVCGSEATQPLYSQLKSRRFQIVYSLDALVTGSWDWKSSMLGIVYLTGEGEERQEFLCEILEFLEAAKSSRAWPTKHILFVLSDFIPLLVAGGATMVESLEEYSMLVVK